MAVEDGPFGFTLQKYTFSENADAHMVEMSFVYDSSAHRALLIMRHTDGTITTKTINPDYDNGTLGSTQNRVAIGDYVIGAQISLSDGRRSDRRTGTSTAGIVARTDGVTASSPYFGIFTGNSDASDIIDYSVGGSSSIGSMSDSTIIVNTPKLDLSFGTKFGGDPTSASNSSPAIPVLAINTSGITATDSDALRYSLTVYTLSGARASGQRSNIASTDPSPLCLEMLQLYRATNIVDIAP
jgi:hypothetical protein